MSLAVAGSFEQFGNIEVELSQRFGLRPHGYLIDIGCGSGRPAVKFVRKSPAPSQRVQGLFSEASGSERQILSARLNHFDELPCLPRFTPSNLTRTNLLLTVRGSAIASKGG
jgi:hypothetical protein